LITVGRSTPRHRNFDMVVSRSMRPSIEITPEEITSAHKPPSACRASCQKPNEPPPWPMSKITPRCRDQVFPRAPSVGRDRALGKGRKQWVRMSPAQRLITSGATAAGRQMRHQRQACSPRPRPYAMSSEHDPSNRRLTILPIRRHLVNARIWS